MSGILTHDGKQPPMKSAGQHFEWTEVRCRHCGKLPPFAALDSPAFMRFVELLELMRVCMGGPLFMDSWYRCPEHPIEKRKGRPGPHSTGYAADVRLRDPLRLPAMLAAVCSVQGIMPTLEAACGIGIPLSRDFIHVDRLAGALPHHVRPAVWLYKEK